MAEIAGDPWSIVSSAFASKARQLFADIRAALNSPLAADGNSYLQRAEIVMNAINSGRVIAPSELQRALDEKVCANAKESALREWKRVSQAIGQEANLAQGKGEKFPVENGRRSAKGNE
jgi:hypothetical protein